MSMVDHVIALKVDAANSLSADWYGLHHKLYRAIGDRTEGEGEDQKTLWQYSLDPRAIVVDPEGARRFVVIRANQKLSEKLSAISVHKQEAYVPAAGERVRYFLHVSTSYRKAFVFQKALVKMEGPGRLKRLDARIATDLLTEAGITPDPDFEGPYTQSFPVRNTTGRGGKGNLTKHGVVIAGTGVVSDLAQVTRRIEQGVGRDRGFGFGLLIVEPMEASS